MAGAVNQQDPVGLSPGARVGHYEIVAELGRGGAGVVYLARDTTLGRQVALKSPLPEHATDEDRRRFLTEAQAASRLSHPAIVSIFEAFEVGERPWLAMALAEGRPLRAELAERGALPIDEVVRHGEMLADALRAAHVKHVLHRDVTPNNVFVTPEGRVLLMDFGLARFFIPRGEESRVSTHDGSDQPKEVAGTIGYMSPEQSLARTVDPTTDIFALGAVLYEMCTGQRAFQGSSWGEILDATLHRDPPPISRLVHDAPPELERIVRKALAKRVDERYATAEDSARGPPCVATAAGAEVARVGIDAPAAWVDEATRGVERRGARGAGPPCVDDLASARPAAGAAATAHRGRGVGGRPGHRARRQHGGVTNRRWGKHRCLGRRRAGRRAPAIDRRSRRRSRASLVPRWQRARLRLGP